MDGPFGAHAQDRASGTLWRLSCVSALVLLLTVQTAAADPATAAGPAPVGSSETKPEAGQAAPQNPAQMPAEPRNEPASAPKSTPDAAASTNLGSVNPDEAVAILGKKVRGANGKDILGPVIDVLVDGDGHPRAAIIDFGGFLGVGSRKIAVDWQLLKIRPADRDAPLLLSLERAQIQAAPEYKETTQPAAVVVPPPATPATPDDGKQTN